MDFFNVIGDGVSSIFDSIGDAIITGISGLIGRLLYYITNALMWIVQLLQQLFNVFAGVSKVQYDGEYTYLIDVFLQQRSISTVYWGMAFIGIIFVVAFAIVAVIRKVFDMEDKEKRSYGDLFGSCFKSIFTMVVLTLALSAILNITNLVVDRISYVFDNAENIGRTTEIKFTDEQFATMARIYNTIGNYAINPSYSSRYNLNSCYNDIRMDLESLVQQGVFDLNYVTKENGSKVNTWQSVLQELVYASDPTRELKMDVYYSEISNVLLKIMEILRTDASFFAIEDYKEGYTVNNVAQMDRVLFLSGTSSAARNSAYNRNPFLTDGLRGAFYIGERSIYDYDDVTQAFDTSVSGISYLFIWILAFFTIRNLLRCIFVCTQRIISIISLYVVAPLTLAPMPLDNGEKFKQWTTAMTVQMLGILGYVIPMRLVLLFAPIIMNSKLVLFESVALNFIAKALLIVGAFQAVEGFGTQITGILVNNAGMAALRNNEEARQAGSRVFGAGVGAFAEASGISTIGNKVNEWRKGMVENGGLIGNALHRDGNGQTQRSEEQMKNLASDGSGGQPDRGGAAPSGAPGNSSVMSAAAGAVGAVGSLGATAAAGALNAIGEMGTRDSLGANGSSNAPGTSGATGSPDNPVGTANNSGASGGAEAGANRESVYRNLFGVDSNGASGNGGNAGGVAGGGKSYAETHRNLFGVDPVNAPGGGAEFGGAAGDGQSYAETHRNLFGVDPVDASDNGAAFGGAAGGGQSYAKTHRNLFGVDPVNAPGGGAAFGGAAGGGQSYAETHRNLFGVDPVNAPGGGAEFGGAADGGQSYAETHRNLFGVEPVNAPGGGAESGGAAGGDQSYAERYRNIFGVDFNDTSSDGGNANGAAGGEQPYAEMHRNLFGVEPINPSDDVANSDPFGSGAGDTGMRTPPPLR